MSAHVFAGLDGGPRREKPRDTGLTMVIDWGTGPHAQEDLLAIGAAYFDLAKVAVGVSRLLSDDLLRKKITRYRQRLVEPFPGGQFLEYAEMEGKAEMYLPAAVEAGYRWVEVSDNLAPVSVAWKAGMIRQAVEEFRLQVLGEVGKKEGLEKGAPMVDDARACLEAGAAIVLLEAAELVNPETADEVAAGGGHEALRCIAPSVAPGSFFRDWVRYDGCFAVGNAIRWSLTHASCRTQPPMQHFDWEELNRLSGPEEIAARVGFRTPALAEWAEQDRDGDYWEAIDQCRMHEKVRVPGLHAGGWFDHLTRGQYAAYRNIRDRGATPAAREGQRLVIGPWGHQTVGINGERHCRYGDWEFGAEADFPLLASELQFLDFHLKDEDNGYAALPPVRIFLMGENRWVGLEDWPPPGLEEQRWYLDSDGAANMRHGDGRLSRETPGKSAADAYTHDPRDPVPTRGGAIYWGLEHAGPVDIRPVLERPDALYYRSEKLAGPLTVIGEPGLDLQVSSDAADTDFVARLCVEEPSGEIVCLCLGSLRCRYREGWKEPKRLAKGAPTAVRLRLGEIGYTFPAGSRIGLMIASSDFPRILPHAGSMAPPWQEKAPVKARNGVLHGSGTLSCLRLPVVEL